MKNLAFSVHVASLMTLFPFASSAQMTQVMDMVSSDSIMKTIKELTGALPVTVEGKVQSITTRFALTTGNRVASRYIRDRFLSYGLDVEMQPYSAPYDPESIPPMNFTGLSELRSKSTIWLCSDWGEVFSSSDTGPTWVSRIHSATPDSDRLDWISALDTSHVAAMGKRGTLAVTTDGGDSWERRRPFSDSLSHFFGHSSRALIAVGQDGSIWRSANLGSDWTHILVDSNVVLTEGTFLDDNNALLVGRHRASSGGLGRIVKSTDGGTSWVITHDTISSPLTSVHSIGPLHAWAATSMGEVYRTIDGGLVWTKNFFADTPSVAKKVYFTDNSHGWVLTSTNEMYRSSDGGEHWSYTSKLDSPAVIGDFLFLDASNGLLVGQELYGMNTSDGGTTWVDDTVPLMNNVLATLRGTERPEMYIMLGAHADAIVGFNEYDRWGFVPGADDDGSGVAVLIEFARVFAQYPIRYSVKFLAIPDEEVGAAGTEVAAERVLSQPDSFLVGFDVDMVGYDDLTPGNLNVWHQNRARELWSLSRLPEISDEHDLSLNILSNPGRYLSDLSGFLRRGYPVVGLIEGDLLSVRNPNYHRPSDTWDTLNPDYIGNVARALAGLLYEFGSSGGVIWRSPESAAFENAEVGASSDTISIQLANIGTEPLSIAGMEWNTANFAVVEPPSFPLTVNPAESKYLSTICTPEEEGVLLDTIHLATTDTSNPVVKIPLSGKGIVIDSALPGVIYAVGDSLHTIDKSNGESSTVGALGAPKMRSISIRGATNEIYTVASAANTTDFYRVGPSSGGAVHKATIPIGSMSAFAFNPLDDKLYGGTPSRGKLYQIDLESGDTTFIGSEPGVRYNHFTFYPGTSDLWALAGSAILRVDIQTGDTTLVVKRPDLYLFAIAFDASGELYGLGGIPTTLEVVDKKTGSLTTIGPVGVMGLSGLAVRSDVVGDVEDGKPSLPTTFDLHQNYPNPFNPATTIRYELPKRSHITLTVYNVLGEEVATLVDEVEEAGHRSVRFDATDLASGMYLYRLRAGDFVKIRKLLVLK